MRPFRKLLLTGSTGFVGRHVEAACSESGALSGWQVCRTPVGLDIRSEAAVRSWVADVRPEGVLHLAAQSFVPRSFEAPRETLEINVFGTLNLLQALDSVSFAGPMIYVSSGDVYGRVPDEFLPVDDSRQAEPRSPYAVSKVAGEQLCLQWQRTNGLHVMVARPFNHIGPGQDRRFVLPALAGQVVSIAGGRRSPIIEAGDIDTTRDFTDVRDVVGAYAAMLDSGLAGNTYLIASGHERRIRDLLAQMCAMAGIEATVHQDQTKIRPAEQRRMVADSGRLRRDTGWYPKISIETTLTDILIDARKNQS